MLRGAENRLLRRTRVIRKSSPARVLMLTAATAVWGSAFVVTKETLTGMAAADFLAWRFGIAAVVLALLGLKRIRALNAHDVRQGVLLGVFLAAGFLLQTTGLRDISAALSGFLTGTMVVLTPLVASGVFKERVSPARLGRGPDGGVRHRAADVARVEHGFRSGPDHRCGSMLRTAHRRAEPVGYVRQCLRAHGALCRGRRWIVRVRVDRERGAWRPADAVRLAVRALSGCRRNLRRIRHPGVGAVGAERETHHSGSSAHGDVDRQTALTGLLVLGHHVPAGLAHGLDHRVEGHEVGAVAMQRERCR